MMERTPREKEFDAIVASVVRKAAGHVQSIPPPYAHGEKRLYSVTTLAASPRYGGMATPVICTTFKRACEIVEDNEGDLFETSYKLVVIEAFLADCLYSSVSGEQYWYVWEGNCEDGKYVPIERPEAYAMTCGWGVG